MSRIQNRTRAPSAAQGDAWGRRHGQWWHGRAAATSPGWPTGRQTMGGRRGGSAIMMLIPRRIACLAPLSSGARQVNCNSKMGCARPLHSQCLDVTISVTLTCSDCTEKLAYHFFKYVTAHVTYVTLSTSFSLFIWSQNFEILPVENDFATWES